MNGYFQRYSTVASLVGLSFSIVCFLPTVFATELTPAGLKSFAAGVFVLFCSFVVTTFFQQVELEKELTKHVDEARKDAKSAVGQIHEDIEKVAPITRLISSQPACAARLSEAAAQLHIAAQNPKHPQIVKHASRLVTDLHTAAASLVDGKFVTEFWNCDILRNELERMEQYLIGYSPLIEADETAWWDTESGCEFLEANRKVLAKNGCAITRIFCVEVLTDVEKTLRRHRDLGVNVYFITPDRVDPNFHRVDESSAVIDGKIAYHSETQPGNAKVNIWTVAEPDVLALESRLKSLKNKATRFK